VTGAGPRAPLRSVIGPTGHAAKLARSLYSGRIADQLREAIIDGSLPGGTPLVEMRLAEQLSVSRGPVRNALHALENEGLVRTRPNGRVESAGFSERDLDDLFVVRFQLESLAVRTGLEKRADVGPVEEAFAAIEREGASTPHLVELDIDFHRALVGLGGSRFLLHAWLAIAPVIQAVITLGNRRLASRDPASNFRRIVESHARVVEAVSARDSDEAARLLAEQFALTTSMFRAEGATVAADGARGG
jgi:GntR family transcriptional regulator, gluconate operon transcriptional repressor